MCAMCADSQYTGISDVPIPTTKEILIYMANYFSLLRMRADSHAQWGLVQHVRVNEIAALARALRCAVLLHGTCMNVHLYIRKCV
jgi:hypothetical protein